MLKASVKDNQGKEVTADANTVLFSREDKRPPVQSTVWFYAPNTEFDATHPGCVLFRNFGKGCLCDDERILR